MSFALKHHLTFGGHLEAKHYAFSDGKEYIEIVDTAFETGVVLSKDEWEDLVKIGNGFFSKEN